MAVNEARRQSRARSIDIGLVPSGAQNLLINSPVMSLTTAAANQGGCMVPFAFRIKRLSYKVITAPTAANSTLLFGKRGDTTNAFGSVTLTAGAALTAGLFDVDLSTLTTTLGAAGDVVEFATGGGASGAGLVAASMIVEPL